MGAFEPLAFDRITAVLQGMSLGMKAFKQRVVVVVKVVNIVHLIVLSYDSGQWIVDDDSGGIGDHSHGLGDGDDDVVDVDQGGGDDDLKVAPGDFQ